MPEINSLLNKLYKVLFKPLKKEKKVFKLVIINKLIIIYNKITANSPLEKIKSIFIIIYKKKRN